MADLRVFYTQGKVTAVYAVFFPVLAVLSLCYFVGISLRHLLYKTGILKTYRPKAKVISIGNLTLGGSGKTPCVEYLAKTLAGQGRRVAVLIRGYKRPQQAKDTGSEGYYRFGDEAAMLKSSLAARADVFVGTDRRALAAILDGKNSCDVMILDDGFQHWPLARDLDIVTIDATRPFGFSWLLPLGHLREGLGALQRAQVLCLTRCDELPLQDLERLVSRLKRIHPNGLIIRSVHAAAGLSDASDGSARDLNTLQGAKVAVVCAIAHPESFLKLVGRCGASVVWNKFFEDHHEFSEADLSNAVSEALKHGASMLLVTQKDAPRLEAWARRRSRSLSICALNMVLEVIEGNEALNARLDLVFSS